MGLGIGEIIGILLPVVSFIDGDFISENTPFLMIIFLLVFYFYSYPLTPLHNPRIESLRKYLLLISGAWLTVLLITELKIIVIDVYKL
jgi:hypothetical protein